MNIESLEELMQALYQQEISPKEAFKKIKNLPYENLGFAMVDHHRQIRTGMPEVIFCQGKSPDQTLSIIQRLYQAGADVLATRLSEQDYETIRQDLPEQAEYLRNARCLVIKKPTTKEAIGKICVVTAGTSDIAMAEEAAITAETYGSHVERIFDVGVAGIHRLFDNMEQIRSARVLVVAAGMDGALASVIGGLVEAPVIALPTSVGYGASFGGVSALLAMLNSCATGVAVVNIDNGFGAGSMAHRINVTGQS
ncbi:MAG: nickel pincer cofactor biosynthesis protein LarB [Candidatus Nitrohelix vancouverensis]|uniref:Nickel pincer cofactor biosynthesis protein LarB n=1 Tax=Candidatus Nitrohelix vancouverensis TaxID=2705534 RepID=A0A7T0C3M9_9BACT|nr:MAG: nickel pincer cofactor biosynthesis protein LarB [Candidatus Nitrohelix vancouverensis]